MSRLQTHAKWKLENQPVCSRPNLHLLLCMLNTHSLRAHTNDIVNDYDIIDSNILCLQEVHLPPSHTNILDKYNSHTLYHIHGITTFVTNNLQVLNIKEHKTQNSEAITLTLPHHAIKYNVTNICI